MQILKWLVIIVVVLGGAGALAAWRYVATHTAPPTFRTAEVKRADLVVTIGATGTVEPEEVIDVAAQVAGQIIAFGKDDAGKQIDYGSVVEENMILAQIDATMYQADVDNAQATVDLNKAGVLKAQADLVQMQAKLDQAERDWGRAQKLGPSDALAESAYDGYRAAYEVAKANVEVDKAAITATQRQVEQAQSQLVRAQRNLSYCTIKSPVKGVIIDRRVNMGQTVVSSLNAPSLFLLAKDLHRMQVWVAVNEADIGNIHAGQPVTFTVDAFPGQTFQGEVGKVRLNATMTQNVVTYTVEVVTDNSSGKLLPYLTANVQFELSRRDNVLQVPNAALRWTPAKTLIAAAYQAPAAGGAKGEAGPETTSRPATTSRPKGAGTGPRMKKGTVWVREGEFLKPITVRYGQSDSVNTEIQSDELQDGAEVVIGEVQQDAGGNQGTMNPFAPSFGRSRSGGSSGAASGSGSTSQPAR